jgi:hypothetical protein
MFHVTNNYVSPDIIPPNIRVESVDASLCRTARTCSDQDWIVWFSAQDDQLGLYALRLSLPVGSAADRFYWWRDNHVIGSRDPVYVGAALSCCIQAVSLAAEDMAANQLVAVESQAAGGGMNWRIVVGVSVGVGVLVLIVMAVFGTCLYRKKYHNVPQDGL